MPLNKVYALIWDEQWWFPTNISGVQYGWKDLENQPGSNIYLPQLKDIQWSLALGLVLVMVRYVIERIFLAPLATKLGIQVRRKARVRENPTLEAAYIRKKRHLDVEGLTKQTDLTVRQVETWFRDRKKQDSHTTLQKFCDSGWHFMFYVTIFTYGLTILWNKPWFSKTIDCWVGWPLQNVTDDVYWYYLFELAFYWSLIFTLIWDPKRADFYQMLVHHVATIVLMNFSWLVNFVRIGTLVLIVHDVADPLLEQKTFENIVAKKEMAPTKKEMAPIGAISFFATMFSKLSNMEFTFLSVVWTFVQIFLTGVCCKMFYVLTKMVNYLKWKKTTDCMFVVFALSWITSRHIVFPYAILYSTTFEILSVFGQPTFFNFFFNFFLYLLLALGFMWTYHLIKAVVKKLSEGEVTDTRSDSETEDSPTENGQSIANGKP